MYIKLCLPLEVNAFGSVIYVSNHENIPCGITFSKHVARVIVAVMAEAPEESFSLDEFETSVIENVAAVPNVDNITTCSCRGYCLRDKERNFCPCKSINSFCSSSCHGGDHGCCMNNRRVQENDSDETVRSY